MGTWYHYFQMALFKHIISVTNKPILFENIDECVLHISNVLSDAMFHAVAVGL